MKTLFARFAKDESGVTAIEYGLIAALIGVVIIVGATAVGGSLRLTMVSPWVGAGRGGAAVIRGRALV